MKRFDYAKPLSLKELRRGRHRRRAGKLWERMGALQLDFLVSRGLTPESRLLDVGCGPLRAGIRFVEYLAPGNYYGIDINQSLLDAGYDMELPPKLRDKLPRDHLRQTERFDSDFGVSFDFALAQSLFTHIPLNDIRLCLYRVAQVTKPGGRFYVSFFEAPDDFPLDGVLDGDDERKRSKYGESNPFWYWPSDLEWAASFAPWRYLYLGDWGHPRNQKMIELTRVE